MARTSDHAQQIRAHEAEVNRLHGAIHATARLRDRGQAQRDEWRRACAEFHAFQSPVTAAFARIADGDLGGDAELRTFAFRFLEVDPYYFRSGYALGDLLRKIKRLDLSPDELSVLRSLIMRRILHRGLREFRALCRFIPQVVTSEFHDQVLAAAQSGDRNVARRAHQALGYFPRQTGSRFSTKARAPSS